MSDIETKHEMCVSSKAVKKMILDNRRITIRVVADGVGISFDSCQAIFTSYATCGSEDCSKIA